MIRINDILLSLDENEASLPRKCAEALGIKAEEVLSIHIHKKSVDARKKNAIRFVYAVDADVLNEAELLERNVNPKIAPADEYKYEITKAFSPLRPLVVGFGPSGMFAGLVLAEAGLSPIIIERGGDALTRREKVDLFWKTGKLDPECNVQFGEGGAGTFSDGKLTTGTKNERIRWVLEQYVLAGAPESILYDSKPHIGTDILVSVVQNIRNRIVSLGGEVRFEQKLIGLNREGDSIAASVVSRSGTHVLKCGEVILAIGHSARDTVEMLYSSGVKLEPKAFSMGVRIEHLQKNVNLTQYGESAGHPALPPADYKLSCHLKNGSAYTFCMCPGGYVVAAASEEGGVVTNGMSLSAREGENANSALLVSVTPEDFPDKSPLGGMYWQREIEHAAFVEGGGGYSAVTQTVGDFLGKKASKGALKVSPTYKPGVRSGDIRKVLPPKVCSALLEAIPELSKRLRGFDDPGAIMTAPETRSSSPVRIVRGDLRESSLPGLYPCGEGAGYAGGIMSAAVDGMLTAEEIIKKYI